MFLGAIPLLRQARPSVIGSLSAMLLTSCLAAASNGPAARSPAADVSQPSHLDYMMLASMADSPHLMAMAAYRPTGAEDSTRTADPSSPQRRP